MTTILSNEDVRQVLNVDVCLEALDGAYREHGAGRAVQPPITQCLTPAHGRYGADWQGVAYHALRSMPGSIEQLGTASIRIDSDIVHWPRTGDHPRRVKIPAAFTGQYVGLILLFSTDTGEPLAIIPDGIIQAMRVAGTCALGARHLARQDAAVLGLIGTGWQARAHLQSLARVRNLSQARVYSTDPTNRKAFVSEMQPLVSCELVEAASAEEAIRGADLAVAATNYLGPVIYGDWLAAGSYVSTVRDLEAHPSVLRRADMIVMSREESLWYDYTYPGHENRIPEYHGAGKDTIERWGHPEYGVEWQSIPRLGEVMVGVRQGRLSDHEIIYFLNKGDGIQLTAVGSAVLRLARERGLGHEIPTEWLVQPYHP